MTPDSTCDEAVAAVATALRAGSFEPAAPAALIHISGCPRCRAGLLLTLRRLASVAVRAPDLDRCASFRDDLAGFVELEQADPPAAAARYPAVWDHLWGCAGCFEEYLSAQAFLAAERAGEIPPLAMPTPTLLQRAGQVIQRILLKRRALMIALPPARLAAGPMRGDSAHSFVVFDHSGDEPRRQLKVVVREQSTDFWQMEVQVIPPLNAVLLVSIGARNFTARFGSAGTARIEAIPAQLVIDEAAPDIEIALLYPDEQA